MGKGGSGLLGIAEHPCPALRRAASWGCCRDGVGGGVQKGFMADSGCVSGMLGSLSKKENQPPNKRCFYNERKSLVTARQGKAEESITASRPTQGASSGSRTKPSGAGGKGSAWERRGSSTMADLFTASAEPGCPL